MPELPAIHRTVTGYAQELLMWHMFDFFGILKRKALSKHMSFLLTAESRFVHQEDWQIRDLQETCSADY